MDGISIWSERLHFSHSDTSTDGISLINDGKGYKLELYISLSAYSDDSADDKEAAKLKRNVLKAMTSKHG